MKKDEVDCDDRTPFRLTRDSFVVREVIPPIPKEPWNFAVCQPEVANVLRDCNRVQPIRSRRSNGGSRRYSRLVRSAAVGPSS